MLFCTQPFLVFFTFVFAGYWAMDRRWGRLGVFLVTALYFTQGTGKALIALCASPPCDPLLETLLNLLAARGLAYAMAGIVSVATGAAFLVGHHRARIWLLLLASFYFYACWNKWLALIVFGSTFMDYWVGRGMEATDRTAWRRLLLLMSLAVNLGLLCYFKYANFFLLSLFESLRLAGVSEAVFKPLEIILPVGISFYTFEAINYTVDVYRRRIRAETDLGHFLLFITFFPHLVAGPIVRARDFLPQIRRRKRWDWPRMQLGVQLFLMGLFKKLAIADRMALFSDPVFGGVDAHGFLTGGPAPFGSYAVWVAALAYTLQIYCDFSGYSDMALGCAHLLGYKLVQNFDLPYLSANVSEFWHRWHISLSSWLRDYLFIPLGGSRQGRWRTHGNLLLTMTLGGLWHGANWTFVVWGLYHGLLLMAHRVLERACKSRPRLDGLFQSIPGTVVRVAATFLCVVLGWVCFRAATFGIAGLMFQRLFWRHAGLGTPLHDSGFWYTVLLVVVCHALARSGLWERICKRLPAPALGVGYGLTLSLVLLFNLDTGAAFIYFQF